MVHIAKYVGRQKLLAGKLLLLHRVSHSIVLYDLVLQAVPSEDSGMIVSHNEGHITTESKQSQNITFLMYT